MANFGNFRAAREGLTISGINVMNKAYRELFSSRIDSALAQANAVRKLSHSGVKGEIVEILLRDLFRPLLPSDIGVATGQIAANGVDKLSRQQDVIIYDKSILPPILYEGTKGLIPIESVLYTIEVKTTLTRKGLTAAHKSAKELISYPHLSGQRDSHGKEVSHPIDPVRSVLFAIDSDLTRRGVSEIKRYRDIYAEDYPYIRAICVANKEYWWEDKGTWTCIQTDKSHGEVLGFLGGISNTYKWVSKNRGWPNLGNYIIPPDSGEFITEPSGTMQTVEVRCEQCNNKGIMWFAEKKPSRVDMPDGFVSPSKCYKCGGTMRSPSGVYELKDGIYVLVT